MLKKSLKSNKLSFSIAAFSLPFLPFSGFFSVELERKPEVDAAAIALYNSVSTNRFVPSFIDSSTALGMWIWQRKYVVDPWERILMLDFCQSHGIERIFVQVHFDRTPEGNYSMANQKEWNDLLATANALNIKVEALDGDGNMGFITNLPDTVARLRAVLDFHLAQPEGAKFSGIHYDIEPYTTPRWIEGEHREIAVELLEILSELGAIVRQTDPSLTYANDIPFWYDGNEEYYIEFNGEKKYLNEHIQDLSDYIGIMSYRTRMTGENSTADIVKGELEYGNKIGRPVYPAIETAELLSTPDISFFGRSAIDVASSVRELGKELRYVSSFGGILIHEYETLRLLGDQWDLSAID